MSLYSMTGYGKGRAPLAGGEVICEISAVNNRSLALYFRLPQELREWEPELRTWLKGSVLRGKVNVTYGITGGALAGTIQVDTRRAAAVAQAAQALQTQFPHLTPLSTGELLLVDGVVQTTPPACDADAVSVALQQALREALDNFNQVREQEGETLGQDIRQRLQMMSGDLENIQDLASEAPREYREKLTANLAKLAPDVQFDPVRVAQEIAMAAENCDVSEEIVRLTSHIAAAGQMLDSEGEVGRRLDFLTQEMLRETNTIGSKTITLAISRAVLRLKGEIDKIKEQVQNLE